MKTIPRLILLTTILLGGLTPLARATTYNVPGTNITLTYEIDDDEVTITDCNTDARGTLDIPANINGLPVTTIGDRAFFVCFLLASVTIPDNVTTIGDRAFYSCGSLASITIGDSVTTIGDGAFERCASLTDISVDSNNGAFVSIEGVLYNKALTTIIVYPAGKSATSFTIPESVTTIGNWAFSLCYSLADISVDANNGAFASIEGVLYNKALTTIVVYPAGKSATAFTLPDSVTTIGGWAFYYCDLLTSITIPDSVTSIGSYAFFNCDSLANAVFEGDAPANFGSNPFFSGADNFTVYYYEGASGFTTPEWVGYPCVELSP